MLEFRKNIFVLAWIERRIFFAFKLLQLEEQSNEFICEGHFVYVDIKEDLKCLAALCEFAHCAIVHWRSSELILLSEDLSVPVNNILAVLLEEIVDSDVELLMSLDTICIMEDLA